MGSLPLKKAGTATGVTSRSLNLVEGVGITLTFSGSDTLQIDAALSAGANTFTRGQVIDGTVDENQLRVQGHSTQTTSLLVLENSAGTDLLTMETAGQLALPVTGSAGGLLIGGDTNLYRSATNTLKTDDALTVAGALTLATDTWHSSSDAVTRLYFGASSSTYLKGAGIVFRNSTDTSVATLSDSGILTFGSANDTNLYRSAANTLKTDDEFIVAVDFQAYSGLARLRGQSAGGTLSLTETEASVAPGAGVGKLFFLPGTAASTTKLVVRAGAAGVETVLLDNISEATSPMEATIRESLNVVAAAGTTETLTSAGVNDITLDENITLTFPGAVASVACSFTLISRQDGAGGNTITWPASVDWPAATPPTQTTTAGAVDIYTFTTVNNGTTWLGFQAGAGMA